MNGRRNRGAGIDHVAFTIGTAYYHYLALLERVLADTGLDAHVRPGMGYVLFALFEQDDRVIKQIAGRTELSQSALSGLLAKMEAAGLVEMRRDDADGRAVRVRLTALGRSLEPRCRDVLARIDEVMLADVPASQVAEVQAALKSMIAAVKADEAGRRPRNGRRRSAKPE